MVVSVDGVLRVVLHKFVHRVEGLGADTVHAVLDTDAEVFVPVGCLQRDRVATHLEHTHAKG